MCWPRSGRLDKVLQHGQENMLIVDVFRVELFTSPTIILKLNRDSIFSNLFAHCDVRIAIDQRRYVPTQITIPLVPRPALMPSFEICLNGG